MKTNLSLWLAILALVVSLSAHADDEKKYAEFAQNLRQQVWSDTDPMFTQYEVTHQYDKTHSAVILAALTDVELTRKSYLRMTGLLMFNSVKQLGRHELNRMLVKLNDDAALKSFSEFDYATITKGYNDYGLQESLRQVLGVRVIKPDGTIVNVSTDDYMTTREGKKGKEVSHKLAVPNLEVGDILDIFTYDEMVIKERNIPPFKFNFVNKYPMMHYKVRCKIDDKFAVQYRTLNGAPDFTATTDKDKNTVLETEVRNVSAVPPTLWYNEMEQAPMTILYAIDKSVSSKNIKSVKKDKLQPNPDFRTILNDDLSALSDNQQCLPPRGNNMKMLRNLLKQNSSPSDIKQAVDKLYAGLTYYYFAFDEYDEFSTYTFSVVLGMYLKHCKIPFQYVIATDKNHESLDQLINRSRTIWIIKVGDYYYAPPQYNCATPGVLPVELQGRKAAVINKLKGDKTEYSIINLPTTRADQNVDKVIMKATIDGLGMSVERIESRTGGQKEDFTMLVTPQQTYAAYDKFLNCEKPFIETVSKKNRQGVLQAFEKANEAQQDFFKEEVELYHGQHAREFFSYEILSDGLDPAKPELAYQSKYLMDGLVKRAGGNLVVSIGKLIGTQIKVEEQERERVDDVNRKSPTMLSWDITLQLPDGYHLSDEGLSKLQQELKNSAGEFVSTATLEGNILHLVVNKCYLKAHLPVAEWPNLLQILDTADQYTNRQIVLEK